MRKLYGKKYDYSKVEYKNTDTKICIICPIHGEFWQKPIKHLKGQGCPQCKGDKISKQKISNTQEFINKAVSKHGKKYNYSKVEYVDSKTKICIICPIHGEFYQTPNKHLIGRGCPHCVHKVPLTTDIFIKRANEIHHNKYDYSKVEYKKLKDKVIIICPYHGEFIQTANTHLQGKGCPYCANETNVSETKLFNLLKNVFQIQIEREQKFEWLTNNKSIDIYIPQYNIAIEYQGLQHFQPIEYFGGMNKFKKYLKLDKEKFKECGENGITLLYFTYLSPKLLPKTYFDDIYCKEEDLINKIKSIIQTYENNK